jgi:hypothetical protein
MDIQKLSLDARAVGFAFLMWLIITGYDIINIIEGN